VRFGGVLAVNKVSFDVQRGEVFTLIGPNGAGKTTVFNLISRIYTPTAARCTSTECRCSAHKPPHEVAELGIARTFQNIELFEHATVLQNLLIGRHVHRSTGFWSDLFFTGAARKAEVAPARQGRGGDRVPRPAAPPRHLVAGLPYGVRKVVELARALCTEPKLLLLDEPSSGLNVEETDDMAFWIQDIKNDLGITVLMVEHDMTWSRAVRPGAGHEPGRGAGPGHAGRGAVATRRDRGLPGLDPGRCPRSLRQEAAAMSAPNDPQAGQRRERLRPDQGHPRRQPEGAPGRDRHRAGQQRRRQDHHPEDHLRHHRPAPRQRHFKGDDITAATRRPSCARPGACARRAARCSRCCRCTTTC
jgi:branched-chain amino acid transport system ATP-binding protein